MRLGEDQALPQVREFVSYIRVSTQKQGQSGLGLEAQSEAVGRFVAAERGTVLATYTEVETGKGANALARRPQLAAALAHAKKARATLIIAKLDRLARNVAFISALMESGADFVAVDNPHATRLTMHILAAVAEHEREMTSQRTKAALAAARARGTVLGAHSRVLAEKHRIEAMERLAPLAATLEDMRARGLSVRAMTAELRDRKVPSPGGGGWHPSSVHKALGRLHPAVLRS